MSKTRKKQKKKEAEVHKDLKGFDISLDSFGQMTSNLSVDRLNEFLNSNINDKRLIGLELLEEE